MNTTCFCIYCKRHPLHDKRNKLKVVTGWKPDRIILDRELLKSGVDVDCLEPKSDAFDYLKDDPEDFEYETTAYDDGYAATGFYQDCLQIYACCGNEEYEG